MCNFRAINTPENYQISDPLMVILDNLYPFNFMTLVVEMRLLLAQGPTPIIMSNLVH